MTYRKVDTCIWKDPWFENLGNDAKLAFFYFWTNDYCNPAGIYEISNKRIAFDLGYGIDSVRDELKKKLEWFSDRSTVWVKNFFRHQCQNSKFAIGAINSINQDQFKLKLFIDYNHKMLKKLKIDLNGYGIDTI